MAALVKYDWCPDKRRKLDTQETPGMHVHRPRVDTASRQHFASHREKPQEKPVLLRPGSQISRTVLKSPSLWYCLMAALGN